MQDNSTCRSIGNQARHALAALVVIPWRLAPRSYIGLYLQILLTCICTWAVWSYRYRNCIVSLHKARQLHRGYCNHQSNGLDLSKWLQLNLSSANEMQNIESRRILRWRSSTVCQIKNYTCASLSSLSGKIELLEVPITKALILVPIRLANRNREIRFSFLCYFIFATTYSIQNKKSPQACLRNAYIHDIPCEHIDCSSLVGNLERHGPQNWCFIQTPFITQRKSSTATKILRLRKPGLPWAGIGNP